MRLVQRRITVRKMQPRPPWTWRPEWPVDAPRTCLSSHRVPIYVDRSGKGYKAGSLDYMLRLYQHAGMSQQSVRQGEMVLYDAAEWEAVRHVAEWLEYVDNRREEVFRCDTKEAILRGRPMETDEGPRFAVPITAYQMHERD